MINYLDLLSRILISAIFLFSGINKILNYDSTVQWMEGFSIPGILLMPAIALEIVFPLLIIIGYKVKIAASILAIFCISTAFIFHFDFTNQMQIIAFSKNLGLAGGLLFLAINGCKGLALEKEKKYVRM
ncbi:MAG: DoxX family protein [Candidatus Pelagibacter sp. TMED153]|nr:MAG: DoxX family protein [Candidatus Pelagibacter sp. TMED153]|tara:strand:- start:28 stop:414 length:387 start_codon:yes stop_codon:yes gene_type:complete